MREASGHERAVFANERTSAILRVLIVDDEPIAREVLRDELAGYADLEVVGEAENGPEAVDRIGELRPDLVLLDLQMPGFGGFDVIHRLPRGALPFVVIVTRVRPACRAGVRGRRAGLPLEAGQPAAPGQGRSSGRVRCAAISRRIAESLARVAEAAPGAARARKVVGRSGEEYYLLDLDDVLAFQAEREIVWIVTAKQRYLATQPLKAIEERLRDSVFQRVHRNALVNVNHVRKMTPLTSQRWLLTLSNGQELIVSKRQAADVRQLLQW